MGIQNLLRFMKPYIEPIHIKKYSGKRVGIDAYSWLHKGAYSCSMELCLNSQGETARRYLKYFMHHINLLRHYKITPVVVFDGGNIPCKSATEHERHRKRETNLALAKEKLNQGNVGAAIEFFQKAVRITPSMAHQLIQILRSESIEFIVAPYEADAQLAYLSTLDADRGGIAAVITEDSDLIAYCCQAVIFKMDRHGNGEEIVLERVFNSVSDGPSFRNLDKDLFTGMCILAGCDFLPSIPGIGIKRAYSLVTKYKNMDRVLSTLKFDKRYQMPEDYSESFQKAAAVFHHARIYDAETKTLKPLRPLETKHLQSLDGDLDLLGPELPPSIVAAIAEGHLNPSTMEAFDHFPKVESCLDPVSIRAFDHLQCDDSHVVSTEESCLTIFATDGASEEQITVIEQIHFDPKKYMKEALALGKLVAPLECRPAVENVAERPECPDNNPFKKRKVQDDISSESKSCSEQVVVLTNVNRSDDILYSSPESQESVNSKPNKKVAVEKDKNQKKTKSKKNNKSIESEKSSILKFFTRL